jgi:hypothetical protein
MTDTPEDKQRQGVITRAIRAAITEIKTLPRADHGTAVMATAMVLVAAAVEHLNDADRQLELIQLAFKLNTMPRMGAMVEIELDRAMARAEWKA